MADSADSVAKDKGTKKLTGIRAGKKFSSRQEGKPSGGKYHLHPCFPVFYKVKRSMKGIKKQKTKSAGTGPISSPQDGKKQQEQGNDQQQMPRLRSREYVKPIKTSPLGLNEDDLLYGSDQLTGEQSPEPLQLRHHSGHFRHKAANIWDPHPMYEFTAFQKKFNLVLEHDSKFASPDLQVTHIWHNTSARMPPTVKSNGCLYKGYVKGDPASSVAVSLCHGMRPEPLRYNCKPSSSLPFCKVQLCGLKNLV
ncbi:hypothetical protein RUM44_000215 [Polyplax serrata]|uniref:Peptidase M12B propeptide domain-containing protein n=1 Tax=Polyplax serrata TaxID=468196 RepID=A0ABR1B699_POLSC